MTPLITLAPWERTPDWQKQTDVEEPLIHEIPWDGKMVPFVFQYCGIYSRPHVFARPIESPEEGNWLVCQIGYRTQHTVAGKPDLLLRIIRSLCEGDGEFLLARFCTVSEQFFVDAWDEECDMLDIGNSVILFEDGEGYWCSECKGGDTQARFGFSIEETAFHEDGRTIARAVDRWMSDPNSDIVFARRWNLLREEENARAKFLLGEENQKQIEAVMRWTLLCEPRLWQYSNEWDWMLDHREESTVMDASQRGTFVSTVQEKFPFVFRMQQFLLQHHIPGLCYSLWEQHRCTLDFPDDNEYLGERYAAVEVQNPTAHERIEARLQLRQWLEHNAYPDEIAAIGTF